MNPDFTVDKYLGRRFDKERYNCWDLLREALMDLGYQDIGMRTPDPPTPLAMARRFAREKAEFKKLPAKAPVCIVLMENTKLKSLTPHVGLYYKGRVLHIREDWGTRFETLNEATMGFDKVEFYACSK